MIRISYFSADQAMHGLRLRVHWYVNRRLVVPDHLRRAFNELADALELADEGWAKRLST